MPGVEHLPPQDLGDFFVDRYEVTNRAYKRFVEAGGYEKPDYWKEPFVENGRTLTFAEAMARFRDKTQRPGPATWEVGDYPEGQGDHPVTGVSWYEAAAYAAFAGKRLPSVYHWDRVALTWASGDIVPLSNLAGTGLVPTGRTAAMNRYGTYDLAGNAREWCANASSRGGRFILGGGWNDPPYAFNDAYAQSAWDRSETNGFRCIQYPDASTPDASLEAEVPFPFRDFRSEPGVSDETFALFLNQYRYDDSRSTPQVEETREEEDYTRQKVAFDAAYGGERMAAYLFLPKNGSPPFQTVVLFPGSGAIHTRSSASLTPGLFLFLLKSGRALLYPVYKSTFERGDGLASDYPDETSNWKDHVVMWGKDLRRSIDYLETRPDVDAARLAYMGYSWGAAMGPIMMAVEPRFKAGIVVVAGLNFQHSLPEVDEVHYAPRVKIPVLMLNGKYDFFFPYETSQRPLLRAAGHAARAQEARRARDQPLLPEDRPRAGVARLAGRAPRTRGSPTLIGRTLQSCGSGFSSSRPWSQTARLPSGVGSSSRTHDSRNRARRSASPSRSPSSGVQATRITSPRRRMRNVAPSSSTWMGVSAKTSIGPPSSSTST